MSKLRMWLLDHVTIKDLVYIACRLGVRLDFNTKKPSANFYSSSNWVNKINK